MLGIGPEVPQFLALSTAQIAHRLDHEVKKRLRLPSRFSTREHAPESKPDDTFFKPLTFTGILAAAHTTAASASTAISTKAANPRRDPWPGSRWNQGSPTPSIDVAQDAQTEESENAPGAG